MIYKDKDPTPALFTSEAGARRVADWLTANDPEVQFCTYTVQLRYEKQEPQGYIVLAHRPDTTVVTNGDVEELERRLDADRYSG